METLQSVTVPSGRSGAEQCPVPRFASVAKILYVHDKLVVLVKSIVYMLQLEEDGEIGE